MAEQRKVVTVLFCDLAGSTALGETLDPEELRALLARYFEQMRRVVERHGGSVEKFIGDAVMAVFGVPAVHEDDALRAVRAAAEMRDAIPTLGLQGRIGVMTGEVVTGTDERLATGDAVNVAARLEQAAAPGEVLIGDATFALVRDVVEATVIEPLALKGKSERMSAYRLLHVGQVPQRRHDTLFVGRDRELARLREAWSLVCSEDRCELVTVVGDAGVGKSRLAAEALATLGARVVQGRCLPYGDGITYWPVVEVLKQLDTLPPDPSAASTVHSVLGQSETPTSADDIAWAFRKTLEHAASVEPLIVVIDDIQWGEQTLLDLIEHVALLSTGAPMLLLCLARPELAEHRPAWPVALRLEPLDDDAVAQLIGDGVDADLRGQIAQAAGGNPLFVTEMLEFAGETDGDVVVPPNLRALLAARLDQLAPEERNVLERCAIEGEIFHRGAVQALSPGGEPVTPQLAALVRKQLIRPDRPQLAGQDAFRFRHLLVRDATYEAMPKAVRANLHERYASWLERAGTELVELDEILGYHLERACGYLAEVGTPDDGTLAAEARKRLAAGGHRAARHQDWRAAAKLWERASTLAPPDELDLALETELGDALAWVGEGTEALRRADVLAERASVTGDRLGELCARLRGAMLRLTLEPQGAIEHLASVVVEAIPAAEEAGDDLALYVTYSAVSSLEEARGQMDAALVAWERAVDRARSAGLDPSWDLADRAALRFFGSTPVSELLAWLDENEQRGSEDRFFHAYRAGSLSMIDRVDEARAIIAADRADLEDRGGGILLANLTAFECVWVERRACNFEAAAAFAAEGWRLHEALGETSFLSDAAANLAQALYDVDRLDEAEAWAHRAEELSDGHSWRNVVWRSIQAKLLARRGAHADAEGLAREAARLAAQTDSIDLQGDAYADVAEVLLLGGKHDEAARTLEQALECYERKGNLVRAGHMRARLTELASTVDCELPPTGFEPVLPP